MGVEIEFAGIDLPAAADVLVRVLGGSIHHRTDYELEVRTDRLGTLRLEVDHSRLKELGRNKEEGELDLIESSEEQLHALFAGKWSPLELVTPPLLVEDLALLDRAVAFLGARGAQGTREGLLHAFGTHFNPEVASFEAEYVFDHLRAFMVLYDWLNVRLEVDLARKLSTFVAPYPKAYVEETLTRHAPSMEELMASYLVHNPTRNRALDMLPLFAHIDPDTVRGAVPDARIQARPTFHYRLTNSRVGEHGWTVSFGWNHWVLVERLATSPELLADMVRDYLEIATRPLWGRSDWIRRCSEIVPEVLCSQKVAG